MGSLKTGDFYLLGNPMRLGRIEGTGEMEEVDPKTKVVTHRRYVRVCSVLPTEPIKGFVGNRKADACRRIEASHAASATIEDELEDEPAAPATQKRTWTEIWCQRGVPPLKHNKLGILEVDDGAKHFETQLYCYAEDGRTDAQRSSSELTNRPIQGKPIPKSRIPAQLFAEPVAAA